MWTPDQLEVALFLPGVFFRGGYLCANEEVNYLYPE